MKIAVVDIGSNTIKMKIFQQYNDSVKEIYSEVKNAKLISYINNGILSQKGINLLCQCICELKASAKTECADIFRCFATASLRRTQNITEIKNTVLEICCEAIDVIDGQAEADYSFSGVKNTMSDFFDDGIMLDMGGGSTEIVLFKNKTKLKSHSMNFGSLSLYLDFPDNNFSDIKKSVFNHIEKIPFESKTPLNAVLVGGTALAINKLYKLFFCDSKPFEMDYENLLTMFNTLKPFDENTKLLLEKHVPERATTIMPGLAAYLQIFEYFQTKNIKVSTCGIREGYVYEKILKETDKPL